MNTTMTKRIFLSKPEESLNGMTVGPALKVGSDQTHGAFELFELSGPQSPLPHVHHDHDECFYVIEGTFTFRAGNEKVDAPAGSTVFVPRGTPHVYTHNEGARGLVFVLPANLEGFFRELFIGLNAGRPESDIRAELAGKYDSWPVK